MRVVARTFRLEGCEYQIQEGAESERALKMEVRAGDESDALKVMQVRICLGAYEGRIT